ncbi:hypothetical protein CEXT_556641, partial [Caerostris extrusa]
MITGCDPPNCADFVPSNQITQLIFKKNAIFIPKVNRFPTFLNLQRKYKKQRLATTFSVIF